MPDWLQTTLWILGELLFVYLVVGRMLPRGFEVARSIVIAATPEKIHPFIDSFRQWPLWSPFDTQAPNIVYDVSEPASGVGAKRSWKSRKMGDGSQWITASDPKTGVSMKLAMADGCMEPFGIVFTYAPEAGGTRVTWNDRGVLPEARHWRWMGFLLIKPMCGRAFAKGLAALKRTVEAA